MKREKTPCIVVFQFSEENPIWVGPRTEYASWRLAGTGGPSLRKEELLSMHCRQLDAVSVLDSRENAIAENLRTHGERVGTRGGSNYS